MTSSSRGNVRTFRSRRMGSLRRAHLLLLLLAAVLASPDRVWAVPFRNAERPYVEHKGKTITVRDAESFNKYQKVLTDSSFDVVDADVVVFDDQPIVLYILSNGEVGALGESDFREVDDISGVVAPRVTPRAIAVSNDADGFDVSCNASAVVVVGANSATPVSLIDLAAGREVATVPYADRLARAVAVDDAGSFAIVVLDNPTNNTSNEIRRVAIGAGTLQDTGEQLAFGADFVSKVRVVPGGRFGVALVGVGATRLVSFSLPGLAIRGSVTLGGGTGNALVVSEGGDRVYVRSGRRAIVPDIIEGFTIDSATGAIGQVPVLRIDNVPGFTGILFLDPMALSPAADSLLVAEGSPAPRIARYSIANGALLGSTPLSEPARGVSTPRTCRSPQTAVEFHHAAFDHYFVTTLANEIALLDNGTLAGWTRTGASFPVYASGTAGTAATCRFFSTAFGLRSSHFYTPVASECVTVKSNPAWQFEGEVFNMTLPAADGSCAPPEVPLYRLYNDGQGGAPNHRYTTRLDLRAQMQGQGWVPEGNGIGVIGCVPGQAGASAR